jgi:hypothetical protein
MKLFATTVLHKISTALMSCCPYVYVPHCCAAQALNGAKQLLSSGKVRYLMTECNTGIIGIEGGKHFIQFLHQVGFEVSPKSFQGPFWTAEQVTSGTAACSFNLFARRRAA